MWLRHAARETKHQQRYKHCWSVPFFHLTGKLSRTLAHEQVEKYRDRPDGGDRRANEIR
jgi:hypothetical protein